VGGGRDREAEESRRATNSSDAIIVPATVIALIRHRRESPAFVNTS